MASFTPDRRLDCRGLGYPAPILKAEQALRSLSEGQLLEVVADDRNSRPDLQAWADQAGGELLVILDRTPPEYSFFVRKLTPRPSRAVAESVSEAGSRLFLIVLRTGFEYTPIVRSAFMYASLAAAMNFETVVYCVQAGADTMVREKIGASDQSRSGEPTILERFTQAREMGVRVEVCEQTANVRGIAAEDLIDGVTLKGGALLIDYASRATGQLTF